MIPFVQSQKQGTSSYCLGNAHIDDKKIQREAWTRLSQQSRL